jgi:hypothetical protein
MQEQAKHAENTRTSKTCRKYKNKRPQDKLVLRKAKGIEIEPRAPD